MQSSKILLVTTLSVGSIGLALASGCSSSSSPASTNNDAGGTSSSSSSGGTASSSGSALGDADISLGCMDSTTCMTGQVCCASVSISGGLSITSACQAGPCPTGLTSYQLCAMSSECPTGQICELSPLGEGMICAAGTGDGGTTTHEGGTTEGGSGDGGGDTGASDAPTGG
jgi:hypothetical protein